MSQSFTLRNPQAPASPRQISYIESMTSELLDRPLAQADTDAIRLRIRTMQDASDEIGKLKPQVTRLRASARAKKQALTPRIQSQPQATQPQENFVTPPPKKAPDFIPGHMVALIKPGRYATNLSAASPLVFIRISITGKRHHTPGSLKVQTQHGDNLENRVLFSPEGKLIGWYGNQPDEVILGQKLSDLLLGLIPEQDRAAVRYGRALEHCCNCNASLTDKRSRYYGIGPECEKSRPGVILTVESVFGEYDPNQPEEEWDDA